MFLPHNGSSTGNSFGENSDISLVLGSGWIFALIVKELGEVSWWPVEGIRSIERLFILILLFGIVRWARIYISGSSSVIPLADGLAMVSGLPDLIGVFDLVAIRRGIFFFFFLFVKEKYALSFGDGGKDGLPGGLIGFCFIFDEEVLGYLWFWKPLGFGEGVESFSSGIIQNTAIDVLKSVMGFDLSFIFVFNIPHYYY